MLGRAGTAYAKKAASKFEDSDDSSHMSRPRAMSELPHRPGPRVPTRPRTTAAVASETGVARHRAPGAGRGTTMAPRSPLHEKKPAGAGGGVGSRVAELEAKLGKAHDQLAEMRGQLAAAKKSRKDVRAEFVAAKQSDDATSAPTKDNGDDHAPAEQKQKQNAEATTDDHVTNGGDDETRSMSSPATEYLEPTLSESENKRDQVDEQVKKASDGGDEVNDNSALVADGDGERGNPEADQLRSKLAAKDWEVYEVRAKLMVRGMEADALRVELTKKDTAIDELTAKLAAKDVEIAALGADNAALAKAASEGAEAAKETMTAARAREIEVAEALRESAAREARLDERLASSERMRETLEAEARRSHVQSEQWRKAAEEAAAVLGGAGAPGDKDMRRHGSVGASGGKIGMQDAYDEGSGARRRSVGAVRLLADLWKKKSPK